MTKKAKVGKQRKDRYYSFAKEIGYRSRAAFKLIQLNRKHEFLQKAKVCLDLCAAPGGWMQVARQNMPVSSIVLGVDLFPIKPIPNCISLVEDITTEKCRAAIQRELKTWKVDVVLHDGAPNLGQNWVQDAYKQLCLTLSALRLSTLFLKKNGWFVTKVFRSNEYMKLFDVLKKLFKFVSKFLSFLDLLCEKFEENRRMAPENFCFRDLHARDSIKPQSFGMITEQDLNLKKNRFKKVNVTKPDASRKESAEIYMVCKGFLAPTKIDPKLLDPNWVFVDSQADTPAKINYRHVLHPEKVKKVKAVGYPDNVESLYKTISVEKFMEPSFAVPVLAGLNEIRLDNDAINNHKATTNDIRAYCKDIKILGTSEIRALLKWQKKVHADLYATDEKEVEDSDEKKKEGESGADKGGESEPDFETLDDEQLEQRLLEQREKEMKEIEEQVAVYSREKMLEEKRKRKKTLKERKKLNERLNLSMVHKNDQGPECNGEELFSLRQIKRAQELQLFTDSQKSNRIMDEVLAASEVQEELAEQTGKPKFKRFNKDDDDFDLDEETGRHYVNDSDSDGDGNEDDDDADATDNEIAKAMEAVDEDSDNDDIDDEEQAPALVAIPAAATGNPLITDLVSENFEEAELRKADEFFAREPFQGLVNNEDLMWDMDMENVPSAAEQTTHAAETDDDDDEKDVVGNKYFESNNDRDMSEKGCGRKRIMDAESLALGAMLINSKRTKRDFEDDGWCKQAFNDDKCAPQWFLDDEKKHNFRTLPVSKDLVEEYKKHIRKFTESKKAIEAKARKKKRGHLRFEKAKKKIAKLLDDPDVSTNDKTKKITKLYKHAKTAPKKEVKYVVSKRGTTASKRLPKNSGSKTRYKRVDPRMKKDNMKKKRSEKSKKKPQKRNSRQRNNRKEQPEKSNR